MTEQLAPIGMGLGTGRGYSGSDLTNPRGACLRGEVPFLNVDDGYDGSVLELRIHGVGGAAPEDNLEAPATLQVSGDGTAGFFRPWYPGGRPARSDIRREAYSWGKLNYRSATRALWLLLIAFMIVNVAHWALPAESTGRRRGAFTRGLVRVLGLALTAAFVATAIVILADMIAYQAPRRDALPTWLRYFASLGVGPRLAIALLAVLAIVALLFRLSLTTARSYEQWGAGDSADRASAWALSERSFWRGERTVVRQRYCHVMVACAAVMFVAVVPNSSHEEVRTVGVTVAVAITLLAVILCLSRWTDRSHIAGQAERGSDVAGRVVTMAVAAATIGVCVARFWWEPVRTNRVLAGSHSLVDHVVFGQFAIIILLALVLVTQRPWRQTDVMGYGMAAVLLALLASLISTIFSGALTLTIANLLGSPQSSVCTRTNPCARDVLYLPSAVYAGGIGMLIAIAFALLFGAFAVWWIGRRRKRLVSRRSVVELYGEEGAGRRSIHTVAGVWASSALTDLSAGFLTWLTVPTAIGLAAEELYLVTVQHPVPSWLQSLASFGGTVGVLATGYFLLQLRSAILNTSSRRRYGLLWDVGTFWPRACHPFAPPCYAERSVPELVTRIRRVVGDRVRGAGDPALAQQGADETGARPGDPHEAHSPVLLSGYSQGSPIAVAVVAQLPEAVLPDVALLTLAAPVRRLYGRTFPAYFGPPAFTALSARLTAATDPATVRWRNLVRRSDYIGGWAVAPPGPPDQPDAAAVDQEILDPPALWVDDNPTPPPIHRHSDFFPDPQTRPYARGLANLLPAGVDTSSDAVPSVS